MIKGLGDMMKQAKQVQENMQKMQAELADLKATGESGAGLVKVTMTGKFDVTSIHIDDSLLQEDKSVLEDLIAAAVNDTVRRIESANKEKMSTLTGGMPLPDDFKFPF